jgi:hypothetical protein
MIIGVTCHLLTSFTYSLGHDHMDLEKKLYFFLFLLLRKVCFMFMDVMSFDLCDKQ